MEDHRRSLAQHSQVTFQRRLNPCQYYAERPAPSATPACELALTAAPVAAQEGLDIAGSCPSSREAAAALVQRSRERWATIQSGQTCDDVTAIVCRLH